jgi:tyrosine-protein kinase Etk/Wzc
VDNNFDYRQEESFDFKAIFFKIYHYWYFFIITIFISLLLAFILNKYTHSVFEASTTILIEDERSRSNLNPEEVLDYGSFSDMTNLENEIGKLKSYPLASRVISEMNMDVSYYEEQNFISYEIYKNSPFTVIYDENISQPLNLQINIKFISSTSFTIEARGEKISLYNYQQDKVQGEPVAIQLEGEFKIGEEIIGEHYSFRIFLKDEFDDELTEKRFYFTFNNPDALISHLQSITVEPINQKSTIIKISLTGNNRHKLIDFLNKLTEVYRKQSLEKKNQIAINTIAFIDSQLTEITDSLIYTEAELQDYRASERVMSIDYKASEVFGALTELESKKAELLVKLKYYRYLKEYLIKSKEINDIVAPSSIGVDDDLLTKLIIDLGRLDSEKSELLVTAREKNPMVKSLDEQILKTKVAAIESIDNIIQTSNISLEDLNNRIQKLEWEISKLPATQRELLGIERKFKLNDAIYTYLLRKRSEAQIAKASNLPDNEVIDPAIINKTSKVSPKTQTNYLIALIIALIIPISFIFIKDYLNDKIIERRDVENITKLPIIGHIIHSSKETKVVVADYPKSSISESFRAVRTNLQFLTQGKEKQTLLVTSTMVSEGKTFVSTNLASIFALFGKKTLLVGFDLRKPRIYQDFGLTNTEGISSYLIGKSNFEDIIQEAPQENLFVVMAGPVPPNPSELIASKKTEDMFNKFKERFDYIIIDTPPVGLVTDAFLLMKYADANIFVVRQNFSNKKVFGSIIRDVENRDIPNTSVLINDVNLTRSSYGYGTGYGYGYGYGYSYGYGYGYGYGYYSDEGEDDNRSLYKRIFSRS